MEKGQIMIICGEGKGKTSAAIGRGISGASKGKSVIIIRFLKGKVKEKDEFIKRLEPEIKVFSFEKWDVDYESFSFTFPLRKRMIITVFPLLAPEIPRPMAAEVLPFPSPQMIIICPFSIPALLSGSRNQRGSIVCRVVILTFNASIIHQLCRNCKFF